MLKKYENSFFKIIKTDDLQNEQSNNMIIQTEVIQNGNEIAIFCEMLPFDEDTTMLNSGAAGAPRQTQADLQAEIDSLRAVKLNDNPFNAPYGNCTIGEIFDRRDTEFIKKMVTRSTNKFLREKFEQLIELTGGKNEQTNGR